MSGLIPNDVLQALKASGVEFDENGNPTDDDKLFTDLNIIEEDDEEESEDEEQDQETNQETDEDEDQSSDEDDEEDDEDDSSDEEQSENEEPALVLTKKEKQAPKQKTFNQEEEFNRLREELSSRIENLGKNNSSKEDNSEGEFENLEATLREEAKRFRQMRMNEFARTIERDVNSLNLGVTFKDIIASAEWEEYLQGQVLGATVSDLYVDAINKNDANTVLAFFTDFNNKYSKQSKPEKKTRKKLSDLAVPDKTKATQNKSSGRKKFDYEENDYKVMLEKAERGKISVREFNEFDEKFTKAMANGRVKKST